jgi:hypothetical protein
MHESRRITMRSTITLKALALTLSLTFMACADTGAPDQQDTATADEAAQNALFLSKYPGQWKVHPTLDPAVTNKNSRPAQRLQLDMPPLPAFDENVIAAPGPLMGVTTDTDLAEAPESNESSNQGELFNEPMIPTQVVDAETAEAYLELVERHPELEKIFGEAADDGFEPNWNFSMVVEATVKDKRLIVVSVPMQRRTHNVLMHDLELATVVVGFDRLRFSAIEFAQMEDGPIESLDEYLQEMIRWVPAPNTDLPNENCPATRCLDLLAANIDLNPSPF